jgi:hypothetical protein
MKVKNNALLFCIKTGLDVAWYISLVTSVLTLVKFISQACRGPWHELFIPVRLSTTLERYYPAISIHGSDVSVQAERGVVMISNQNPLMELPQIIFTILISLLTIGILYNFRKVFGTIYRKEPFLDKNIRRLKISALYIALFFVLDLIYKLVYYLILKNYNYLVLKSYHRIERFHMPWAFSKGYLEVAAIVYIMAEILRYGLELKRENEEFV